MTSHLKSAAPPCQAAQISCDLEGPWGSPCFCLSFTVTASSTWTHLELFRPTLLYDTWQTELFVLSSSLESCKRGSKVMVEYKAKAGGGTERPTHSLTWIKDPLLGVGVGGRKSASLFEAYWKDCPAVERQSTCNVENPVDFQAIPQAKEAHRESLVRAHQGS